MKGTITITLSAKEAIAIIGADGLPKSVTNKVVAAFRGAGATPQGKVASAIAKGVSKTKGKKFSSPKTAANKTDVAAEVATQ